MLTDGKHQKEEDSHEKWSGLSGQYHSQERKIQIS